jgi:hypothetical protein
MPKTLLQAYTRFVHCGVSLGEPQDVSAWTGRATGVCTLSTDGCALGQQRPHFLRLEKVFVVDVSDATMQALLHYLQQSPEEWRGEPHIVMPCFNIRYPTIVEIASDLFRSVVGVPTEPLGANEKLQCAQFTLMTLLFVLRYERICEYDPPELMQLARHGCSLTPDALFRAIEILCRKYPQIYETRLTSQDFGGNMYLDSPQQMVPLSAVIY